MNKECIRCGWYADDACHRRHHRGLCALEKAILTDAGLNPAEWEPYGKNGFYIYVRSREDKRKKLIVNRERRMIAHDE